jgi:phosphate starvation-inducible protein PhoH and related proteins
MDANDRSIELRDLDEERALLGSKDHWRRLIHDRHQVEVVSRGGALRLIGSEENVDEVRKLLERALEQVRAGESPSCLADALERHAATNGVNGSRGSRAADGAATTDTSNGGGVLARGVRARTEGQHRYVESLRDNEITIVIGPAGSGKTYLAVASAVAALRRGDFRKLVLARPAVEAGERLGFLPGDLQAKVNPYLRPLYDALFALLDPTQVQRYIESDVIEICPLAYMRGRTLERAFIILDEAQNTTPAQMKMFLTRMGEGSRIVVTGDPTQTDLPRDQESGLGHCLGVIAGTEGIGVVQLHRGDIVRHPLVQRIVDAYERHEGVDGGASPNSGRAKFGAGDRRPRRDRPRS